MSQFKCLQSFFLPLSLRLKDTYTREEAVNVGLQGRYGRGAAPWPSPPSSSSSLLHSFVSSSLISRGDPRVCSRSWLTSQAFCWAFSTADTHARHLERKQTHASYSSCIRQEKGSLFFCVMCVFFIPQSTQTLSTVVKLRRSHTNTLVQLLQQDTTYLLHLLKIWEGDNNLWRNGVAPSY